MKSLDPSGTGAQRAIAQHYLAAGNDAMKAADYAGALKDFDQAASAGSAPEAVTANTFAAFAIMSGKKPDYDKAKEYALKAVSACTRRRTGKFRSRGGVRQHLRNEQEDRR